MNKNLFNLILKRRIFMKHTLKKLVTLLLAALLAVSVLPLTVSAADEEIEYKIRPVKDGAYTVSAEKYNSYESEHFQVLWGDKNNAALTEAWLEANCKILEACWDVYMNDLGMTPPSLCTRKNGDHTTHYKVNVVIMGTGIAGYEEGWAYGGIDSQGYAYLMCDQAAMSVTPGSSTWVTPHEFGHCTQFAQGYNSWEGGAYLGSWYEAVGNWFREQYLYSEYYTDGQWYSTDFSYLYLRSTSLTTTNGRAYYEAWPILQYLTENPDNLEGYGSDFMAKLLQNGDPSGLIYDMIENLAEADLDETLGYFAAHMATLDLNRQEYYINKINNAVNYDEFFWQQFYTTLEPVLGAENTYTVPSERAPQQAAYVVTPLSVTGDEISVTLNGTAKVNGAAWKACLVTVSGDNTTYSKLFGDGETMTVSAKDVDEAYLTVAATPKLDTFKNYDVFTDLAFKDKNRYPYEAVITGAVPQIRVIDSTGVKGSYHENGGGFVASTAKVSASAYVGPNAKVLGSAKIQGDAVIDDYAVVKGSAVVKDNARIDGYAVVAGNAKVTGHAHVGDNAVVTAGATISGNGQAIESAFVGGNYSVKDNAIAKGLCILIASGKLTGQGVADGDLYDDSGANLKKGTAAGYLVLADTAYARKLKSVDGLYLGYEFAEDKGYIATEKYSSTYALVRGAKWSVGDDNAKGVYTFDGESSYIILDASSVYSDDIQIEMNVCWNGGDNAQKLFHYTGSDGEMYFTPKNADGLASFVIKKGDETVVLTSDSALTPNEWTKIEVTFVDGKAALSIAGKTVHCVETSLKPSDVCEGSGYLGRGSDGEYFSGSVDYAHFYFTNASAVSTELVSPVISAPEAPTTEPVTEPVSESGCGSSASISSIVVAIAVALISLKKKKH